MLTDAVAVYRVTGDEPLALYDARGKDATCIAWIPQDTLVNAIETPEDGWVLVRYAREVGYCMADCLTDIEDEPDGSPPEILCVRRDALETIRATMDSILAGRYTPPP